MSNLLRAAIWTDQSIPHQKKAWENLERKLSKEDIEEFLSEFTPDRVVSPKAKRSFELISQRDNKGDLDRDGRQDWLQTCNVTSVAMVIRFLTGKKVSPSYLDREVRSFGSRYNHADLVKLMNRHGVKSKFSVSTSHSQLQKHLAKGLPAIWSNKLTHGGHIVCVVDFNLKTQQYLIYDSYGEPFATNSQRTRWTYKDVRKPYWLSKKSFDAVNMNGAFYYREEHWVHLCS